MIRQIANLISATANAFFVSRCAVCGAIGPDVVCRDCLENFELIVPPWCESCGIPFLSAERIDRKCGSCIKDPPHFDRARALFVYDERSSLPIKRLKYSDRTEMVKPLGRAMADWGLELLGAETKYDFVLPVPLHRRRLMRRGYNQSALLTAEIGRHAVLKVDYSILHRIRNTRSQTRLSPSERKNNVRGAFAIGCEAKDLTGKSILLLDDVMTTGSTLNECSRILKKQGGAEIVDALVVARRT
jgi:ComF family protein